MEIKAKLNSLRIAPRKTRLIADLIRKKNVKDAERILAFTYKRGVGPILKLLKSAVANAENNFKLKNEDLFIKEIKVDKGITLKRWMPRARGKASRINKRASHITLILNKVQNQKN